MIKVTPNYNLNYQYFPQKKNENVSFGANKSEGDSFSCASKKDNNINNPLESFLKFLNSVQNGAVLKDEEFDEPDLADSKNLKPMFGELSKEIISFIARG